MTSWGLKLIALLTMTIDHIGWLIVGPYGAHYQLYRIIGRMSFVLFAFLVSEGIMRTKNKSKYVTTMLGFALGMQIIWNLFKIEPHFINVFFTLGLGALAIYLYDSVGNYLLRITVVAMACSLAYVIDADYGAYGVLLICLIEASKRITKNTPIAREIAMAVCFYIITIIFKMPELQMYGLLAFIPIALHNRTQGYYHPKIKYLIYIYYPLHLLIIIQIANKIH